MGERVRELERGEGIEWTDVSTPRYDLTGWLPRCKSREKHYSSVGLGSSWEDRDSNISRERLPASVYRLCIGGGNQVRHALTSLALLANTAESWLFTTANMTHATGEFYNLRRINLLLGFTILFNVLGHQVCSSTNLSVTSPTTRLILQPFRRFTYVTAHSPTLPLHHLRHSSFSNPSFASPTSQALHLSHRLFTYITGSSLTSQALHLRHLASSPC